MLTLFIDTAQERGLVAIGDGVNVLGETHLPVGLTNSHSLFFALDALLKSLEINRKDLKLIIAGVGPGSYTGIRVAAATAQALSFGLKLPLVGIPTLSGFIPESNGPFAALIDAKISGVYLQKGMKENGVTAFTSEPKAICLEMLPSELEGITTLISPKLELLRPKIEAFCSFPFNWEEKGLSASCLVEAGLKKFKNGEFSMENRLNLLYLRKTQAELEQEIQAPILRVAE